MIIKSMILIAGGYFCGYGWGQRNSPMFGMGLLIVTIGMFFPPI